MEARKVTKEEMHKVAELWAIDEHGGGAYQIEMLEDTVKMFGEEYQELARERLKSTVGSDEFLDSISYNFNLIKEEYVTQAIDVPCGTFITLINLSTSVTDKYYKTDEDYDNDKPIKALVTDKILTQIMIDNKGNADFCDEWDIIGHRPL